MSSVRRPAVGLLLFGVLFVNCQAQQTFQFCVRSSPRPALLECVGRQALSSLTAIQESENYTIDAGFTMVRDEDSVMLAATRAAVPSFLDQDPTDFRGMLENAGAIVGQRSLQWDLSVLQPGLCLRIGPSAESASMLEFRMDPTRHDRGDRYLEEPSTPRLLAKQFIVPFLLGLKFNLVTILPLFFGLIILLCKKAAFLGKLALFVTGLLGYGSAFSLGGLSGLFGGGGGYGGYGGGYGGGYWPGGVGGGRPPLLNDVNVNVNSDYPGGYYKYSDDIRRQEKKLPFANAQAPAVEALKDRFYDYEKKVLHQGGGSATEEDYGPDGLLLEGNNGYPPFVWKSA